MGYPQDMVMRILCSFLIISQSILEILEKTSCFLNALLAVLPSLQLPNPAYRSF